MLVPLLAALIQTPPFISSMFSDNMVLQRDMKDPVWGWATPGSTVTVTLGKTTSHAKANNNGLWLTNVGPFHAGGPYTLTVSGPRQVTFNNVMFGDVWLCSGQSNMEMGIANVQNADQEIANANFPDIRLYAVPKSIAAIPTANTNGDWKICSPETIKSDGDWGGFSATGYFFGRQLHQDLKVPIGLIHSSWGGTVAQAWTREDFLYKQMPEFRPALNLLAQVRRQSLEQWAQRIQDWYKTNDPGTREGWFALAANDSDWHTMSVPGYFQEINVPELNNHASVVWFRKQIDVPANAANKDLVLHFAADDNDATWVNGEPVGATDGVNTPRAYKIHLNPGKNLIAIRVTDTYAPGGIYGKPDSVVITDESGTPIIPLAGEWKLKLGTAITNQNPLPVRFEDNPNFPTVLFNGMISPVAPFAIKGAIWYQGEANADRALQYRRLLPVMINSWRNTFNEGDFPFYIVQLAGFMHPPAQPGDDAWAELREAQYLTATNVPNSGIATAIDIGNQDDIHPKNKQEVGRRLALVAEAKTYGRRIPYSGPTFKSMKVEGNAIRLFFDHADGGLSVRQDSIHGEVHPLSNTVNGFAIAGQDHIWCWADAKIEGNSVVVSSQLVSDPVAVRYGWSAFTYGNLYNGAGLPAFPFRTDDWPGITK